MSTNPVDVTASARYERFCKHPVRDNDECQRTVVCRGHNKGRFHRRWDELHQPYHHDSRRRHRGGSLGDRGGWLLCDRSAGRVGGLGYADGHLQSGFARTPYFRNAGAAHSAGGRPSRITAGYAFDETSGTTAADASGHGITGTLTNGPTFTPGKNGNAVTLDGVNDYVNLGNPTALQFTGSMTVSAWVYASAFPVDDAAVVSKRTSGEVGFQLDITKDTGPRTIGFKLTDSSGGQMFRYGATTLQLNTWYYITGVYNAVNQTLDVYLNGALDNGTLQGTVTSSQQNSTANVTIGRRAGRDRF